MMSFFPTFLCCFDEKNSLLFKVNIVLKKICCQNYRKINVKYEKMNFTGVGFEKKLIAP